MTLNKNKDDEYMQCPVNKNVVSSIPPTGNRPGCPDTNGEFILPFDTDTALGLYCDGRCEELSDFFQ